ncbi:MAG: NAD(P)-dependent oxidoreductase [Myxococcales bacterium]|nr:NAD(P)-dependent oxidoreductase [Myxococcales bacterium]
MITVLGTGLLGAGFTRALRRRDLPVRVWNRTADKARALEALGATAVASAADAVRGAERVHVVVADDAAVDGVLEAAAPGLTQGALVFDHSTTSTAGCLRRTAEWHAKGVLYQHAPVFMGPGNAAESTGLMLISGARDLVARSTPLLAPMTGKLVDLGPRVDAAAAFKLLGNLFLMALTAGFTDMLALGQAMGVAPREVATLFEHFNPGANVPARFQRMTDADYDNPSWELAMARKDARLMQAEADAAGVRLALVPMVAAAMDRLIAEGHGHADWTILGRDFVGVTR